MEQVYDLEVRLQECCSSAFEREEKLLSLMFNGLRIGRRFLAFGCRAWVYGLEWLSFSDPLYLKFHHAVSGFSGEALWV